MIKFLTGYVRKFHRWLALPTTMLILTILLARETAIGSLIQRGQQILMLVMVLTGVYLFLLPWWARWSRTRRRSQ